MKTENTLRLFPPLTAECSSTLNILLDSIDKALKSPARFANQLPRDIERLSKLLTIHRTEIRGDYLTSPANISAYCRYFMPWNVWRLCRLFSSPQISFIIEDILKKDTSILDIGSGPLTLPIAMFASFEALRGIELNIEAVDHNKKALNTGLSIFLTLTNSISSAAWKIKTYSANINGMQRGTKTANLVCAINVLNEITASIPQADIKSLNAAAERYTSLLISKMAKGGAIFIVEPGVPRNAQFISMLKKSFEKFGFAAAAPCINNSVCAMSGGRRGAKWCHWTIDTKDAPQKLKQISQKAKLSKENAVLSFLLVREKQFVKNTTNESLEKNNIAVRIISEAFKLEEGARGCTTGRNDLTGRYGCSEEGLVLVRGQTNNMLKNIRSGDMIFLPRHSNANKDFKTGALILDIS